MEKLFIKGKRNGYTPEQCGETLTVGELMEILREYSADTPIFLRKRSGKFIIQNRREMIVMKTLEEILQELGSETPFLDEAVVNEDGTREPFTESGGKTYSKLISLLYAVGDLTEIDVTEIVERLDDIAENY